MTLLGFALIVFFMKLGLSNYLSNFLGYLITISLSFLLNKFFVFNSKKKALLKYIIAFLFAYSMNIVCLFFGYFLNFNPFFLQLIAVIVYAVIMYMLLRFYIFPE